MRRYQDELGVQVFLGQAAFTGPDTVEVDGTTLRFKAAGGDAADAADALARIVENGFEEEEIPDD